MDRTWPELLELAARHDSPEVDAREVGRSASPMCNGFDLHYLLARRPRIAQVNANAVAAFDQIDDLSDRVRVVPRSITVEVPVQHVPVAAISALKATNENNPANRGDLGVRDRGGQAGREGRCDDECSKAQATRPRPHGPPIVAEIAPSVVRRYLMISAHPGDAKPRQATTRKPDGVFSLSEPQWLRVVDLVTPSGIETGRNVTGERARPPFPTEGSDRKRPPAASECNEALAAVQGVVAEQRRLAIVAENAIANGDLARARSALRELYNATPPTTARRRKGTTTSGI
jgi:hypothetical protein